uniref:putative disease resistance RPP13-like protein 3 n=1 Tax=Fragaria vesca subsp. vesca TaxID=101020 RepID=UPI0005C82011|nr:PREDICTED: putative disease resistance RPP13-like protein 3 [Fragaria vesca subsp. vesca]
MDAVVRILRYLKSAPGRGVMFSKHSSILEVCGFTDADWAGNITDRRSTSGYFTFVGGNLVTWKSKKQKVVARSSVEAEYRGMAHGVCELLWLKNVLQDLGVKPKCAMQLYCDNKAAIDISQNPVQHDRTKHVEVDRHFIKEKLDAKIISFPFVPTEEQLADILTKGVSKKAFYDSLELVAEGYLNELVERNLVVVTAREIDGRVKLCRVLNLVREYIIPKAKHFITVLEANSADSILHDTQVFGDFEGKTTVTSSEIQKVLKACKLLRVLDLQGASLLENFPQYVKSLTLLRYLNLSETQIKTIPKSIKNLGFLETLDLKQTKVTYLPQEMDELHSLRHLLVYRHDIKNYVSFGAVQGVNLSACNIGALTRIQKLTLIKVNSKIIEGLGELKSLKRLGMIDLKRVHGRQLCLAVEKMEHLSTFDVQSTSEDEILDLDHMNSPPPHLQHLYMKGRLEGIPKWVPQLHSLVKVGLKWSKLKAAANPLEALQELPHLLKLELANYYEGKELIFKAATFKKLMILSLDKFDGLNFMEVESRAMPMLQKLTMSRCQNLKLLPVFAPDDLKSLKEVLLYDMCTEFIANFERDGEGREVFQHVGSIESFILGSNHAHFTGYKNLSPSQWHV